MSESRIQDELAHLLAPRAIGADRFEVAPFPTGYARVYGGQLVAQALISAQHTVKPTRLAHSLHAYYGAPGRVDQPIEFSVTRDRDGRSFSSRRVIAQQQGEVVLTLAASFQDDEPGHSYPVAVPIDGPDPESLPKLIDLMRAHGDRLPARHRPYWQREGLVDWRALQPPKFLEPLAPGSSLAYWFKVRHAIDDDAGAHRALIAFATDMHILHAASGPSGEPFGSDMVQASSLDHAIWFHSQARADEWLLYRTEPVAGSGARALGTGSVHSRDGRLVATIMQQGLLRFLAQPRGHF